MHFLKEVRTHPKYGDNGGIGWADALCGRPGGLFPNTPCDEFRPDCCRCPDEVTCRTCLLILRGTPNDPRNVAISRAEGLRKIFTPGKMYPEGRGGYEMWRAGLRIERRGERCMSRNRGATSYWCEPEHRDALGTAIKDAEQFAQRLTRPGAYGVLALLDSYYFSAAQRARHMRKDQLETEVQVLLLDEWFPYVLKGVS